MQGFNMGRYVPPDLEGVVSANAASGKGHALGARARKLKSSGILTVRFECPFAIWCTTCSPEQIIGQGVRFNAEKKKVGNYYSTAIWGFRFKHTACGGWIEVRTDPKNSEYVVVEGGRRRDLGLEKELLDGEVRLGGGVSEEEKQRLEKEGGFALLEKKVEDKSVFLTQQKRLEELLKSSDRDWADPYEKSRLLRREFRVGRRKRQADERTGEALKDKYGLGVEMLEEKPEDGERARYIDFGQPQGQETSTAVAKPLFAQPSSLARNTTADDVAKPKKVALQQKLKSNTRPAVDPFLREDKVWQPTAKRKRKEVEVMQSPAEKKESDPPPRPPSIPAPPLQGVALVGYDSDSS